MLQETRNSPSLWLEHFPRPLPEYNKYDCGYVVIGGGGIASTGAARISASCALRSGAGLVSIACDKESLPIYASSLQAVMTKIADSTEEFAKLIEDKKVKAIALGSGAGVTEKTKEFVLVTLANNKPVVIDADAITIFSDNPQLLFSSIKSSCIMTPHEGEFKRLFGAFIDGQENRESRAQQAARLSGAVVILKGANTVIAAPDGRIVVNYDAPAYLATAGTGDALAGICAGLLAQGMPAFEAGCAAVWLHTQTALKFGVGLIAEDIADLLPTVLKKIHSLKNSKLPD